MLSALTPGTQYEVLMRVTDPSGNTSLGQGAFENGTLLNVVQIFSNSGSYCAIVGSDRNVACWGYVSMPDTLSSAPIRIEGLSQVVSLAMTGDSVCALIDPDTSITTDQRVRCWGSNYSGQLGNGTLVASPTPVDASISPGVLAIAAGSSHVCALLGDHTVRCWGANGNGQLGNGLNATSPTPVSVTGLSGVSAISSRGNFTCAIIALDQSVRCWGYNYHNELGNATMTDSNIPVAVTGLTGVTSLASYQWGTCAILSPTGNVKCWGDNVYGTNGAGTNSLRSNGPASVISVTGATQLAGGSYHVCAIIGAGTSVKCWGKGDSGELGDGLSLTSTTPITVTGLTGVSSLSLAKASSCALMSSDQSVRCWGSNASGMLGNGGVMRTTNPIIITALPEVLGLSSGTYHSCAIVGVARNVYCWGKGDEGQLGNGAKLSSATPRLVTGLSGVESIVAAGKNTCAILAADHTLRCWGGNFLRSLGDGTGVARATPVVVSGVSDVASLSLGENHSCAVIATDGSVHCWGYNNYGQLGRGAASSTEGIAAPVPGLTGVSKLSIAQYSTCALIASDGSVKCWGDQRGLGSAVTGNQLTPELIAGNPVGFTDIMSTGYETCAYKPADKSSWCWSAGRLPVADANLKGHDKQVFYKSELCGIYGSNHALKCAEAIIDWDAMIVTGYYLRPVTGAENISSLSGNYSFTCAMLLDNSLKCWGSNDDGMLAVEQTEGMRAIPGDRVVLRHY